MNYILPGLKKPTVILPKILQEIVDYPVFSPITLEFPKDNGYEIGDIELGTSLTMPAFMAAYMIHQHNKKQALQSLRIMADAGAIVIAIYSGGGSLSLLGAIDIAFSGTDIVMTLAEDELSKTAFGKELVDDWNKLYAVYGITMVTQGVFQLNVTKLKETWKSIASVTDKKKFLDLVRKTALGVEQFALVARKNVMQSLWDTRIRFTLYGLAIEEKISQLASGALFEIKNTIEVGIKWQEKNYRLAMLEVNGSGALLNDCKIIQLPADYEVVGFITNVKYKPSKLNTMTKEGDLSLVHNKVSGEVALVEGVVKGRFIVKSGNELKEYLSKLTTKPVGKSYTGDVYRSLSSNAVDKYHATPNQISEYSVENAWGRYDLEGECDQSIVKRMGWRTYECGKRMGRRRCDPGSASCYSINTI